ncbi:MAG TPA: MmgE/PrpD family protein [Methylomirabilota bacterium]|nr:MmgE/PrpD family protein [Methylomirabilota bacterium]
MASSTLTASQALAGRVAAIEWVTLPEPVRAMSRRVVLDALGCALTGSRTPEAARLAAARADLGPEGACTVWGTPGGAPPGVAALLNGAHAHLRELDDIGGGGHAGACQVPAALAAAEVAGRDGRDVLVGVVAGHEVSARLSDAASYDTMTLRGWHTTGVYGSLGAAAAAARTLGLDAHDCAHAIGLAGSFTGGTWAFMADGAMSKRVHPGRSAEIGLTAALLARRGVTGPAQVLDAPWGGLYAACAPGESDPGAIVRNIDDGYRILRKGFKPYPVCWGINSSADAALALREKGNLAPDDVARVRITISEMSRRMIGGTRIASVLDAQMSLTYAVAAILVRGHLDLRDFEDAALADPAVHAMMARIDLVVDPAAHGERQTVEIETRDGRRLHARVEDPRGHWDNPLTDAELRAKFLGLAGPALGPDAARAADLVGELERPGALAALLALLRAPAPRG